MGVQAYEDVVQSMAQVLRESSLDKSPFRCVSVRTYDPIRALNRRSDERELTGPGRGLRVQAAQYDYVPPGKKIVMLTGLRKSHLASRHFIRLLPVLGQD